MPQIPFIVSARTARLIGQENFATADGAIIELVKNSYDADSVVVFVVFDIKYLKTPKFLNIKEYNCLSAENNIISETYELIEQEYELKKDVSSILSDMLNVFFQSKNSIYIIDNGEGMTDETIMKKWMMIGTDNKLVDFKSEEGRIKTGAKGIGRFALDRLGCISEMKTCTKGVKGGQRWLMNWDQFEDKNKTISEINAELDFLPEFNLVKEINDSLNDERIIETINENNFDFSNGTIIKISNLKDEWDETNLNKLFKSLSALVPPREFGVFNIYMFQLLNNGFGEVSTAFFNEYDYKVEAEFDAENLDVSFKITRKEFDIKRIQNEFMDIFTEKKFPFDFQTLQDGAFEYTKNIHKILKWRPEEGNELLTRVGNFKIVYFFTKLSNPNIKEIKNYSYLRKDYTTIRKTYERFGGIKIYRDHFRVRPYGESGDDWLDLGKRQASSPASAGQRIGDWKVRSKQIAGIIDISRVLNPEIIDKSDRSALVENDVFETFKSIIIGIINEFEIDRSKILNPFFIKAKIKEDIEKEKELKKQAEELAKKILEQQKTQKTEDVAASVQNTQILIEESLKNQSEKAEDLLTETEKDIEIRLMRSLSSIGLIVSSFDHELKSISNNLLPRMKYLKTHTRHLISETLTANLPEHRNPFVLMEEIRKDHEKLKGWLDYSLNSIRTDKRQRNDINLGTYFTTFKKNWRFVLAERNVSLELIGNTSDENIIRAFELDLDSIFNNLFNNSLEAFKLRREKYSRKIVIKWDNIDNLIMIEYTDNGIGLSDVFEDPNEIFEPFITTKKDKTGRAIGTGLGMYIVKNVIDDYEGEAIIFKPEVGFGIKLHFKPKIKKI
jgi:signal transduction histidine kinase